MITETAKDKSSAAVISFWTTFYGYHDELRQLIEVCDGADNAIQTILQYSRTKEWRSRKTRELYQLSGKEQNVILFREIHRREFEKARKAV